jgi:hypothetical protein
MLQIILLSLSATVVILFTAILVTRVAGEATEYPLPILHWCENTYVLTPVIAYQVYFWANYAGIFNG